MPIGSTQTPFACWVAFTKSSAVSSSHLGERLWAAQSIPVRMPATTAFRKTLETIIHSPFERHDITAISNGVVCDRLSHDGNTTFDSGPAFSECHSSGA